MSSVTGCRLISLEGLHEPIQLADKTPFTIGRQKQFRIRDLNCSRQQVQITPNFGKKIATVKSLGSNAATIDALLVNKEAELREGETLHLALDKVPYKIEFVIEKDKNEKTDKNGVVKDSESSGMKNSSKRKSVDSNGSSSKKAKMDADEGGEDDDEVSEKLRKMRENFAKVPKDVEKPKPLPGSSTPSGWRKKDTLMVYKAEGVLDSARIAAFDMDGTIITTKSGRVFPTSPADWQILYSEIPKKLKGLHKDGWKIVFLTNQLGISRGKMSEPEFRDKAEAIIKHLGCPVHLQAAIKSDSYRKPAVGSWQNLLENENAGIQVDMDKSFYCGDAAGRPEDKSKKKKKDHSCSDRLFAMNVGLKFFTPEEYFLGEKPKEFNLPDFDAKKICDDAKKLSYDKLMTSKQEMIVNVGFPASGKSFFSKTVLVPKGYVYTSRDEVGTWQKCVAQCQEALKSGKSVVVDNTNPDPESRSRYVSVAKSNSVPVRCFYFPATLNHARHNEVFRQLTDAKHSKIPDMVMNSYKSKFVMPSEKEKFSDIVHVPFIPKFKNESEEKLYKMYLLEK